MSIKHQSMYRQRNLGLQVDPLVISSKDGDISIYPIVRISSELAASELGKVEEFKWESGKYLAIIKGIDVFMGITGTDILRVRLVIYLDSKVDVWEGFKFFGVPEMATNFLHGLGIGPGKVSPDDIVGNTIEVEIKVSEILGRKMVDIRY